MRRVGDATTALQEPKTMNTTGVVLMTSPDPQQEVRPEPTIEALARVSRRGLYVVLFMIVALGGTAIAMAVEPESMFARWPGVMPWLIPMFTIFAVVTFRVRGGRGWNPASPEVKAVLEDEFRQANLARAQRATLIVVLAAQIPLALLFASLPESRSVMALAVSTITLGMATLITLFLIFDRP
jgi:FtsH-binding integral membrane protein